MHSRKKINLRIGSTELGKATGMMRCIMKNWIEPYQDYVGKTQPHENPDWPWLISVLCFCLWKRKLGFRFVRRAFFNRRLRQEGTSKNQNRIIGINCTDHRLWDVLLEVTCAEENDEQDFFERETSNLMWV